MELTDIDGVMAVDRACFSVPWSKESFELELASSLSYYVVAEEDDGAIIGYGGCYKVLDQVEITNIAVLKSRRGQGTGRRLLEALITMAVIGGAGVVNLDVRESNEAAKRLYLGYGFKEVGRRKGYYQKPSEDALLLSLDLKEGEFL